jgi:epoxyqueuosine reductase
MNIEGKIKNKAKDVGFDLVGITDLEPSIYEKEYKSSMQKSMYRGIEYLMETEEERLYPKVKFSWARSIIVLGINYWQGDFYPPDEGEIRISRYAIGKDYHGVVSEKLFLLSKFIEEETGAKEIKYYTDTGTLLEKELAQRAGLGWIGKNTVLITEEFGSWVFLGEILLDIELKTDEKTDNKCGDCKICLGSCPSDALARPYSLNIEKCTAYHTVNKKNGLPPWFPSPLNNYIFGCDICQEVCPFNRNAKVTKTKDFIDERKINPSIRYLESLSEEDFESLFGNTSIGWAGKDVLLRNLKAFRKQKAFLY